MERRFCYAVLFRHKQLGTTSLFGVFDTEEAASSYVAWHKLRGYRPESEEFIVREEPLLTDADLAILCQ